LKVLAQIDRDLLLVDLFQFKVGQDINAPTGEADAPKKLCQLKAEPGSLPSFFIACADGRQNLGNSDRRITKAPV